MGNKSTKSLATHSEALGFKLKDLVDDIRSLQDNVSDVSKNFLSKEELEPKIAQIEEETAVSKEKLSHLIEIMKDQQQVINELGNQYTQLCNGYQDQQEALAMITLTSEEKLLKYEEDLQEAKHRLATIEKEMKDTNDFAKVIGIKKTDNMIKKEKVSPVRASKRLSAAKNQPEEKPKSKGKLQSARNQKKAIKEIVTIPAASDKLFSASKENEGSFIGQENQQQANFLDLIINEKRDHREVPHSASKEFGELDLNIVV